MKYTTPYKYASLCGISTQAVYQKIAKGHIQKVQIPNAEGIMKDYIDLEKFPPETFSKKNKK